MEHLQDIKKLFKLALILLFGGIFIFYFSHNPSTHSLFIPCPFHYITGLFCPGCGSQRAIHSLVHGDLVGAFKFNPLLVLTLPILIYGLGITAANWIFGTRYRFLLFYSNLFIFGYFGIAVIYWILRNLQCYPFNLLAPSD
ncbi:DUF2752 domain-containing protein [Aequorivita aurantiaca]|uniref:DUF2752 domain-containing protein n=1 Tax=Aequorivita aurantiaca TaxID=3053356 RepID=UPI00338DBC9F